MPALRCAIQMDPLEDVAVEADTSFALAEAALAKGHEIFTYAAADLRLEGGTLSVAARPVTALSRVQGRHVQFGEGRVLDLATDVDVVLVRQDPPYDMSYITACHLLEKIVDRTLVLNDPAEIRNAPEKIFVMDFPDLMPPTLITADEGALAEFRRKHGDIIVKPLYGNGGAGVFRLTNDDQNFASLLEMMLDPRRPVPLIAQGYLPKVREGDKRILLLDGEPVGAINRVPAAGEARSNMHVGGRAEKVELTDRDREICARIGPALKARRLVLTGIDVIGGLMTEINVTSPTGVQEVKRFGGADIPALFWQWVEDARG
ncbi:glutathione synthetase [Parvularcula bermudensis HTCC2503]|uniref:Glutathione synthetase n=1 Tax=Parvularcula bermudensis (strain ATCC BAA-594 / HTCC2503 / KCTC 12087) TaxID=314260 RepID=E0TGC6_PARBH|nr:glutathione synthase [Parvularcula bermudensis]ADM09169.1 glutathione synthetase [Parvularcula bermudensis HTCC2503]